MNWLAQYFEQRTSRLTLSLWAYPPLVIGPDGPMSRPVVELAYPGAELAFSPGVVIQQGGRTYALPSHFDWVGEPDASPRAQSRDDGHAALFSRVSIFSPSTFNPDFLVTVNEALSFVPTFAEDGSPVFFGVAYGATGEPAKRSEMRLPWIFRGYISI